MSQLPYLASLYEVPLLNRQQELHLFRKLNFLKCKASHLRNRLDPQRPSLSRMDEIERLYAEAVSVRTKSFVPTSASSSPSPNGA